MDVAEMERRLLEVPTPPSRTGPVLLAAGSVMWIAFVLEFAFGGTLDGASSQNRWILLHFAPLGAAISLHALAVRFARGRRWVVGLGVVGVLLSFLATGGFLWVLAMGALYSSLPR